MIYRNSFAFYKFKKWCFAFIRPASSQVIPFSQSSASMLVNRIIRAQVSKACPQIRESTSSWNEGCYWLFSLVFLWSVIYRACTIFCFRLIFLSNGDLCIYLPIVYGYSDKLFFFVLCTKIFLFIISSAYLSLLISFNSLISIMFNCRINSSSSFVSQ